MRASMDLSLSPDSQDHVYFINVSSADLEGVGFHSKGFEANFAVHVLGGELR